MLAFAPELRTPVLGAAVAAEARAGSVASAEDEDDEEDEEEVVKAGANM
jgi:hypothetical protein